MTWLIEKIGLRAVAVLALLLALGGWFAWDGIHDWWVGRKLDRVTEQRDTARAEAKVARKDEAQVTRAADITAGTVKAQDEHIAEHRRATAKTDEVIHDRIRQAPVAPAAAPADDPVVRRAVDAAVARAQGAEDRLRGAAPR